MNAEEIMIFIKQTYEAVANGGTKSQYENTFVKITGYKVGDVIRIDVKRK